MNRPPVLPESKPESKARCPFCKTEQLIVLIEHKTVFAIRDRSPVSRDHMLVIPRRANDTPNSRGGVRGVIPGKMNY